MSRRGDTIAAAVIAATAVASRVVVQNARLR